MIPVGRQNLHDRLAETRAVTVTWLDRLLETVAAVTALLGGVLMPLYAAAAMIIHPQQWSLWLNVILLAAAGWILSWVVLELDDDEGR